ncbi:LOB domain-containing protein 33-like [Eucalyptus grandis]|uniref:LOB domain-containing protein 33-like n=1 Tax=Eucalyptus grandis TaxID=71139 RepID=UPI00052740CB|nr:LOB domain-containing protein 33-like [Eucalyptus grandis]
MPAASKACASCRHQRKRCDGNCQYAELFPASRYDEFQDAQRLFGVNNMHNIVNAVEPEFRKQAAESILMEGNIRRSDPVHGCLGVARRLKWEIDLCQKQLEDTNRHLSFLQQRDRELQRQRQGFNDTLVELPPLLPAFFSNGGGVRSFYEQMQRNPTTTLLDSSCMNYQGLNYRSTYEEGATSTEPFDLFRVTGPWNDNPAVTIARADQITKPEEAKQEDSRRVCDDGTESVELRLKDRDFECCGDQGK